MTTMRERNASNAVTAGAIKTADAPLPVWRKTSSLSGSQVDQPGMFVLVVGVVITLWCIGLVDEVIDIQCIIFIYLLSYELTPQLLDYGLKHPNKRNNCVNDLLLNYIMNLVT